MKKLLLLSILALLGMPQMAAQDDYEYVPFVREGVKWVYTYENYGGLSRPADPDLQYGTVYLTLELKGDTVINGKTYNAMHQPDTISENGYTATFSYCGDRSRAGMTVTGPDGYQRCDEIFLHYKHNGISPKIRYERYFKGDHISQYKSYVDSIDSVRYEKSLKQMVRKLKK